MWNLNSYLASFGKTSLHKSKLVYELHILHHKLMTIHGIVWATWEDKLIWASANSKCTVGCSLWLLFKLTKTEERMKSYHLKILLCSHIAALPTEMRKHFSSRLEFIMPFKSIILEIQVSHIQTSHLFLIKEPIFSGQLLPARWLNSWPGADEARGSIPTWANYLSLLHEPRMHY